MCGRGRQDQIGEGHLQNSTIPSDNLLFFSFFVRKIIELFHGFGKWVKTVRFNIDFKIGFSSKKEF